MKLPLKLGIFLFFSLSLVLLISLRCMGSELIAPTRGLGAEREALGLLIVLSEPPGLDVVLDGNEIGKTPARLEDLKPGQHMVRIENAEFQIAILPGETLRVSLFRGRMIFDRPRQEKKEMPPVREKEELSAQEEPLPPLTDTRRKDLTPWERFINGTLGHF